MINKLLDEPYWDELPALLKDFCVEHGIEVNENGPIHKTNLILEAFIHSSFEPVIPSEHLAQFLSQVYNNGDIRLNLEHLKGIDFREVKNLMIRSFQMYYSFRRSQKIIKSIESVNDLNKVYQVLS